MSTYSMWEIREAVLKNTCRPMKKEMVSNDQKSIRVSMLKEGDSQLGTLMFIGVASDLGFTEKQIAEWEGFTREEISFKLGKYRKKKKEALDSKFLNKIKLIKNYLKLKRK